MTEEERAEVRGTAQNLLTQLNEAEDKEALFSKLVEEYSQERPQSEGQYGYFYAPDVMPEVFENTVRTLSPGEVSGLVESEHAVYILLGKDLEQGLAAYPDQKDALLQSYVMELVNDYQDEMEVERRGDLTNMMVGDFYQQYLDQMNQRAVEDAAAVLRKAQE